MTATTCRAREVESTAAPDHLLGIPAPQNSEMHKSSEISTRRIIIRWSNSGVVRYVLNQG